MIKKHPLCVQVGKFVSIVLKFAFSFFYNTSGLHSNSRNLHFVGTTFKQLPIEKRRLTNEKSKNKRTLLNLKILPKYVYSCSYGGKLQLSVPSQNVVALFFENFPAFFRCENNNANIFVTSDEKLFTVDGFCSNFIIRSFENYGVSWYILGVALLPCRLYRCMKWDNIFGFTEHIVVNYFLNLCWIFVNFAL